MPRPTLREGIFCRLQATSGDASVEMPTNEFIEGEVQRDIGDVRKSWKECQCEQRDQETQLSNEKDNMECNVCEVLPRWVQLAQCTRMPRIKRDEEIRKIEEVFEEELYVRYEDLGGCSCVWRRQLDSSEAFLGWRLDVGEICVGVGSVRHLDY
jgi:hypothetical protein